MLARRNAMRHPGRTLGTAAALMIGVMLVTLVSVVAAGLRDSTSGTLEQRIDADYVLTGSDGWSPTEAAVAKSVGAAGGVTAISSLRQDRALALGGKENVNAIDPATVGKVFSFDITSGPSDAATTLPRDGAIVDQGWAKEHSLGIGDRFTIRSISNETVALRVVAIEDSPILDPLGLGPITISRAAFDPAFEAHRDYLTLLSTRAGFDPHAAIAAHPDGKLQTKASYIDQQTTGIDQLLAIFYVLLALAVIVSLFGIVNTLVLSTFERTRELGMLRAVGMSRRQVRRMVRHESIITALMGAGLGVLLGLGLAAIVTSVFSDEGLTFAVPAGSLIAFGVVAVIAGVVAAILPARRAARLNVLAALAWE